MKKKLIILLFIPFALTAQDRKEDESHQKIIMSVLQQINEYESASSFANERRITQFQSLFVDLNTKIVNDIPAIGNYDEEISIEDYMKNMRKYYSRIGVDIDVHEISKIDFIDENKGSLSVFLTKKVYGENAKHKIQYSEKYEGKMETFNEYVNYEDEFELEIKFEFNNQSVKISNIRLTDSKGKLLVISPHSKKFGSKKLIPIDEIKIIRDGVEIQLSGYFYSIPNVTDKTKITISSGDETLIGEEKISLKTYNSTDETHMFKLPFTKTIGDVQVFGLLSPSFLTVNSNSYNAIESNLSSTSYGFSLSYNLDDMIWKTLEEKKKKKISLYFKGGLIKDNFDYELSIPTFTETYSDIDSDGGNYERTVLLENFSENQIIDLQSMFIQVEARLKAFTAGRFNGIGSISAGMGQTTINSATYSNTADATYSGYYEDLFGITIAENGVYDFGGFNVSQSGDLEFNTSVQTLLLDVSGLIKYKDRLMFSGGIMYTKYQSNIFNIGTDRISKDFNELNSINNLLDVDMSHISFKLGVSYKF
jgi:hypothetical protein